MNFCVNEQDFYVNSYLSFFGEAGPGGTVFGRDTN